MEKLKEHLARRGIKQTEFAKLIGVKQSSISDIVNGRRKPSLALAGRIASATKGRVPVSAWITPEEIK